MYLWVSGVKSSTEEAVSVRASEMPEPGRAGPGAPASLDTTTLSQPSPPPAAAGSGGYRRCAGDELTWTNDGDQPTRSKMKRCRRYD